ncbi:hypothetical protein [Winogradskyella forsetii]
MNIIIYDCIKYNQTGETFFKHLSVLDILFSECTKSKHFI